MIAIRGTDVGRMQEQETRKLGFGDRCGGIGARQQEELRKYLTLFVAKTIVEGVCFDTVLCTTIKGTCGVLENQCIFSCGVCTFSGKFSMPRA